ncbi:polyadenylate-binding protein-interacting protein 3-like isoform X2 [Vicia villosa]|uniref:polyadenylate-binding protein-interacting protein 3-like isoform X2 n=1 Tax=Vicia villosa TaxID=3911 RepID=UPI00273AA3DD|nr:polyadenylate-binding protein-interacting protein 3-like isoform X2 [Vicia villosa]
MNLQQVGQPKSSNGYGRRKSEKDGASKSDNKIPPGKSNAGRLASTGAVTSSKGGSYESPSRDRLVYLTTCLIGQQVEVQVKNGSIYSGIFHATNSEKDFGIILKMACLTKDGSSQGPSSGAEFVSKAPSKTLIIPGKELVQVIAKDVAVSTGDLASESHYDVHQEIMVDSVISQPRHVDLGRELHRWVPDENVPQCPELDNIFDGSWNSSRGWDQFETNKMLFGVKSTFDEELYTTKLEKGPRMRELELQALRIAREIEGEETQDIHLAEERGLYPDDFDIDEETRFSSVYRGKGVDDEYDENEDNFLDSQNSETFGDISDSVIKRPGKSSQSKTGGDGSYDHAKQLSSEVSGQSYSFSDVESRIQDNSVCDLIGANGNTKEENQTQAEDVQLSKYQDLKPAPNLKKDGSDKVGLTPTNASSYAPSTHISSKIDEKTGSHGDLTGGSESVKASWETKSLNSRGRSDFAAGSATYSGPSLSPSSSLGSLSSDKSTLNPYAKEFKLNPNAKSFVPSQAPVRPRSPVSDGSFYYPANVSTVPSMPTMPMGVGVGTSFAGPQPMMYNPQVAQMPSQPYFHQNGPQYGQIHGHPRQVLYMPNYLPETPPPYKGRNY